VHQIVISVDKALVPRRALVTWQDTLQRLAELRHATWVCRVI